MGNDRFKFRCWVSGELPIKAEHTHSQYYFYSDTISDCRVQANIEDIKYACGLSEVDFASYLDYLVYNKIDIHGQIWLDGILEQCTGAKDKNGKLIYEGDILEGGGCRYVVKWDEFMHGFYGEEEYGKGFTFGNFIAKNSVIIGNIHENPELLGD